MKKSEANKHIEHHKNIIESSKAQRMMHTQAEMDIEAHESDMNRARSITVGTAFGGTTEIFMRGNGSRQLWCLMQPVEVIELIHQLAANVGCNADLKPRKDFATWRDWRVSEAEKKHLNGHAPFVNDMAVFQQLGASGYNDEEAQKIMDILANVKEFANEHDESPILGQENLRQGAPSVMFGKKDGLIHNKLALDENGDVVFVAGGNGGTPDVIPEGVPNETMATKKTVNQRKSK